MPHDKTFAEGYSCSPWTGPFIAEYSFLENPAFIPGDFVTALTSYDEGRVLKEKFAKASTIGQGGRAFFGYDANSRKCGNYQFFGSDGAVTTITIFFAHKELISMDSLGHFNAGQKHMITIVRDTEWTFAMCSYAAPHDYWIGKTVPTQKLNPSATPSRTPTPSVTPSVTPSSTASSSISPILPPKSIAESSGTSASGRSTRSACFPASATVTLGDGESRRMDELKIGDEVLVCSGEYSPVFMFTHKFDVGMYSFVRFILIDDSDLLVTAGHFVYINGALKDAQSANVGDTVEKANGDSVAIKTIEIVQENGLYNPQTEHGDIIVNDIRVSTYTERIPPSAAHALLSIFRFLRRSIGLTCRCVEKGWEIELLQD